MNASLLDHIVKERDGHYCHCVEVNDAYELECIAESIIEEYGEQFGEEEVIHFLESLTVYSLNDEKEEEIYAFSFSEFIEGTM